MLGQPVRRTSLEASGQWPVCNAGASPTEDPLFFVIIKIPPKICQEKKQKNKKYQPAELKMLTIGELAGETGTQVNL
jgi:hypothetical protein